jgi:hypothetical protein
MGTGRISPAGYRPQDAAFSSTSTPAARTASSTTVASKSLAFRAVIGNSPVGDAR